MKYSMSHQIKIVFFWGLLLFVIACSGHGPGGACVETMPGMQMCNTPTSLQVVPLVK